MISGVINIGWPVRPGVLSPSWSRFAGVVTLRGTVLDDDDIALVYDIVNGLDGVADVRSELETGV